MNIIPEVTIRTITLAGGLLATGAAVVAQAVAPDNAMGTGSFLLGGAGLIAAISAFTKDFWTDRQKQRDHEIVDFGSSCQCLPHLPFPRPTVRLGQDVAPRRAGIAPCPGAPARRPRSNMETSMEKSDV